MHDSYTAIPACVCNWVEHIEFAAAILVFLLTDLIVEGRGVGRVMDLMVCIMNLSKRAFLMAG